MSYGNYGVSIILNSNVYINSFTIKNHLLN